MKTLLFISFVAFIFVADIDIGLKELNPEPETIDQVQMDISSAEFDPVSASLQDSVSAKNAQINHHSFLLMSAQLD